ncbi:MAG: hypothetical protein A2Z88_04525 [Omnitrophica WOR_2 bacterium GWA2_47_8]|nr:MAG: hypothetical protein A2Z88_04525 [Omnitrophica WOR_2 bacterium GWA2_47_8]
MLKILRKKGVAKKVLWAVAIVIIISFGFFGTAYLLTGTDSNIYAGKIFGKSISLDEFNQNYRFANIQAIITYGENYSRFQPFLNLESETWDRLTLLHEAKKRRIKINDQEVVDTIQKKYAFFKRDGQFDSLLYDDILRMILKITARDFEEGVRDSLMITKLYEQVTFPITVSDDEIFDKFKTQNERVKVDFALIPTENYKDQVTVDEGRAQKYYEEHKNEFYLPAAINIEYLAFEFPSAPAEAPNQTPDPDLEAQKNEIGRKANEAYLELQKTKDINQVAQKNNLVVGVTGFFSQEQPNLQIGWSYELLHQAFQLKEDEITEPIATDKGWYILKLKKKRDAYVPDFAEAKEKVIETVALNEAKTIAKEQAEKFLADIKNKINPKQDNFADVARSLNLTVEQTPDFIRGQYLPTIGLSPEFEKEAFSLSENKKTADNPVETLKGYAILHLASYTAPDEKQFETTKESLKQQLLEEKKNKMFNEYLTQLRLKANLKDNLQKLKENQKQ